MATPLFLIEPSKEWCRVSWGGACVLKGPFRRLRDEFEFIVDQFRKSGCTDAVVQWEHPATEFMCGEVYERVLQENGVRLISFFVPKGV